MEKKIENIFTFLNENRQFNHEVQNRYYTSIIKPYKNKKERIISLLYHIANTQSQPNIDYLAISYQKIYHEEDCFKSFKSFINILKPNSTSNFKYLFEAMKSLKGWGEKTSALFSKSIFHLHNGLYSEDLKIWDDVPSKINNDDKLYLPVDAVIITIFKSINQNYSNFHTINSLLQEKYKGQSIEIWDDLWFWGFITQKGSDENRIFDWNENKYWALMETVKDQKTIEEIKKKSEQFLDILKQN